MKFIVMEDQLIDDLAIALTMGQIEDSLKLYKKCSATLSPSEFFGKNSKSNN